MIRPHIASRTRYDVPSTRGTWQSWQSMAACAGIGTDMFFGTDDGPPEQSAERRAKKFCITSRCPVLLQCREHALNLPERHGCWGATTSKERADILRQRTRKAAK